VHSGDPDIIDDYEAQLDKDAIRDAARALGLMKITVHGCTPDTTYYFKVLATADGDTATWPQGDPAPVTTAVENSFISGSHQLLVALSNDTGDLDALGWLVTASSSEAPIPVKAFVGDGAGVNQAYLNLADLFGADGRNWSPAGSQVIEIRVFGADFGPLSRFVSLDFSNNFAVSTIYPIDIDVAPPEDSDGDGLFDYLEEAGCTDPLDADSDDDGIADGDEDANHNGVVDAGETDPCNRDTDGDGLQDGTELGVVDPVPDPDDGGPLLGTDTAVFIPDADPSTETNALRRDSDGDGAWDGVEDIDRNGSVDSGETNPNDDQSFPPLLINLEEGYNQIALPVDVAAQADLESWLPVFGGTDKTEKVMAYDPATGTYVTLVPGSATNPTFTLSGGEGLIVYQTREHQVAVFTVDCASLTLQAGINLVGYACPAEGYTAFDWLTTLGSDSVSAIQRYATETGAFETAAFDQTGQPVGVDFPIVPGEGYLIYKK
jgi:hypothetical protein